MMLLGIAGVSASDEPFVWGMVPDFPPMTYVDETGHPAGFLVELYGRMLEDIGVEYSIVVEPFGSIYPKLLTGEIDFFAPLQRTAEREDLFYWPDEPATVGWGQLFVRTGSLHVASTPKRAAEICDFVTMGRQIGFEIDHFDRAEAERLLPCMKSDDLIEFCYCPTDGHFQPAELLAAYVQLAREAATQFLTKTSVESIEITGRSVQGVWADGQLYAAPARHRQ